jgi:hypothetical protein
MCWASLAPPGDAFATYPLVPSLVVLHHFTSCAPLRVSYHSRNGNSNPAVPSPCGRPSTGIPSFRLYMVATLLCVGGRRTLSPDGPFTTHIFLLFFANTRLQHVTNCMAHRSIIIRILTSSIQSVSSPLAFLSPLTTSLHLIISIPVRPSTPQSFLTRGRTSCRDNTGLNGNHGRTRHCIIATRIYIFEC